LADAAKSDVERTARYGGGNGAGICEAGDLKVDPGIAEDPGSDAVVGLPVPVERDGTSANRRQPLRT